MTSLFEHIIVIFIGLVLGSFSTALIYRAPQNLPWWGKARSICTYCNTPLKPRDLVPVLSWMLGGGKCRYCGHNIGAVYPLAELMTLLGCLGVYWLGDSEAFIEMTLPLMLCIPFLVALLFIDLRHMILPDVLVLIVGLLGLSRLLLGCVIMQITAWPSIELEYMGYGAWIWLVEYGLGGALLYAVLAWAMRLALLHTLKKDALGMGDIKFFAAAGVWLGWGQLGAFCLMAGLSGIALGILWKVLKKGDIFPFGPSLIVSLYLLLILERTLSLPGALN